MKERSLYNAHIARWHETLLISAAELLAAAPALEAEAAMLRKRAAFFGSYANSELKKATGKTLEELAASTHEEEGYS